MSPLTDENLKTIREHAVKEYPYECCGIVLGKVDTADENILYRCENIQNRLHEKDPETFTRDARTAFYIDPKELMGILKDAQDKKLEIKVFYHSHPEHDAYFSEEDKRMALFDGDPLYPNADYLVVSVCDQKVKREVLFSWNTDAKEFTEKQESMLIQS